MTSWLCVACFLASTGTAETLPEARVRELQSEFEQKQEQTETFQAKVRQTMRLPGVRDPIISDGTLIYVKPDQLLIAFHHPEDEYVLMRGADIILKKKGGEAVHHRIDPDNPPGNMGMLLELFRDGAVRLKEDFSVEMTGTSSQLTVMLHPEDDDNHVRSIENRLRRLDMEIESIEVRMESGQSVRYDFNGVRRNQPVDESLFEHPTLNQQSSHDNDR